MFPSTSDQGRPTARSVRSVLRDAADLAIAFMTLESYGVDDVLGAGRPPRAGDDAPRPETAALEALTATPSSSSHHRALRTPRRPGRPGTPIVRAQLCLTPLEPNAAPTTAPRRRTATTEASR